MRRPLIFRAALIGLALLSSPAAWGADFWLDDLAGTPGDQAAGWRDDSTDFGFGVDMKYSYDTSCAALTRTASNSWGKSLSPAQACDVDAFGWVEVKVTFQLM